MKTNLLQSFVTSIQNVFSTMMQLPVIVKEPYKKLTPESSFEVSAIISFTGEVTGNAILSLRRQTAEHLIAIFAGKALPVTSPEFADALGELLNMIAGGAKAQFKGKQASISCPTVVLGQRTIPRPGGVPIMVIPCHTDCGEVALEIALRRSSGNQFAGTASATHSHA